jgi:hypothetical protein
MKRKVCSPRGRVHDDGNRDRIYAAAALGRNRVREIAAVAPHSASALQTAP